MLLHRGRGRSGITLTEILISIMIMAVGIVSLATLFPLGLLRLRDAARASRSGLLNESAACELGTRNLLSKASFLNRAFSPWYTTGPNLWLPTAPSGLPYDPWIQDLPAYNGNPFTAQGPFGAYRGYGSYKDNGMAPPNGFIAGPGLPVAYDPLWRYQTEWSDTAAPFGYYLKTGLSEARFASGIGFVRNDPNPGGSPLPSAHGLQRLTNFNPILPSWRTVPEIFVSPEDLVLQAEKNSQGSNASPIVPELATINKVTKMPSYENDWRFTWMFTGQQSDATNGAMFDGSVVIFENRPFGLDSQAPIPTIFDTGGLVTGIVSGETVVEAVFGYSKNVIPPPSTGATVGYGQSANRVVLLRWPDKDYNGNPVPDPEVKVGSWIADVTYERNAAVDDKRATVDPLSNGATAFFPYQRCDWYQVAKRTPAAPGTSFAGDPAGYNYREMTVWVTTPLRAQTLLNNTNGNPIHVNAALVCPYVVNVFPRTVYTR